MLLKVRVQTQKVRARTFSLAYLSVGGFQAVSVIRVSQALSISRFACTIVAVISVDPVICICLTIESIAAPVIPIAIACRT